MDHNLPRVATGSIDTYTSPTSTSNQSAGSPSNAQNVWLNSVGMMEHSFVSQSVPTDYPRGDWHSAPSRTQAATGDQELEWVSPWQSSSNTAHASAYGDYTLMRRHSAAQSMSDISASELIGRSEITIRESEAEKKRKAQNRESQRAFRQRKAEHTRTLEQQLAEMEEKYETLRREHEELQEKYQRLRKNSKSRIKADIMDKVDAKLKEINGLLDMA